MLHNDLRDILRICKNYGFKVTITTNGTLLMQKLDVLKEYPPHRINISIHSALLNENMQYEDYIKNVLTFCDEMNSHTTTALSLRVWNNEDKGTILGKKSLAIRKNLYLNVDNSFEWPDLESYYYNENGYCYGLISQIAILCDGTVTPCCLDGNGKINLGNVFNTPFKDIIESERAHNIVNGFRNRKVCEELCKHCSFKEKF
ncbi:MAG: radical SAM protein [Lachnospira sp.]|nr:radical SAM protein [Lachnospira sp.]